MSSVLRASLYQMYAGDDDVINMLDQIDWTELNYKFQSEMDMRMDRESQKLAQAMLVSKVLLDYDKSVQESCIACTGELSKIMSLLISEREGKAN